MPLGPDISYSHASKIYTKQQPDGVSINGNVVTTEQIADVGSLSDARGINALNGQVLPAKIGFGIAKGGANVCIITITVQDNGGQPVTNLPFDLDVILSDAITGIGVTATAPSVSAAITTGTSLNTYVANKAFYAQNNAAGQLVLTITDAAKTGYYVMVQAGSQPYSSTSRQLVAADYGP